MKTPAEVAANLAEFIKETQKKKEVKQMSKKIKTPKKEVKLPKKEMFKKKLGGKKGK